MERPEIAFGEDGPFVSVWVAQFGSQEAVDVYLAEQYDDDNEPTSPFADDIGLRFYDHDFIETHHEQGLSSKQVGAFSDHSWGRSFAAEAWEAVKHRTIIEFDTVLLLYGYAHSRYPQAARPAKRIDFVGTFPYEGP